MWLCHAAAAAAQNPVVTFSHGSASLSESETTISGTVTANPPPQTTLTVRYSVTDFRDFVTASHEGDKTVTFSAHQATAQLTVPIVNDLTDEPNGDVQVALKTGSGYTLGSATGTTFKVVDNDSTSVRLRRTGPEDIDEGEETTFTVTLGRKLVAGETVTAPLTVAAKYAIRRKSVTDDDYSITLKSGSGVSLITSTPYTAAQPAVTFTGSDTGTVQVATLTLAAMADGVDENSFETLAVGLGTVTSNLDRLATGTGTTGTAASGSGSVVIWSYDTTVVSIAAGAAPVTEGANASFTVSADPPPVVDLVVDLKVTDHPGSDFVAAEDEGAKTVTIAAGGASATYTVATQADSIDEPNGVAEVMLVGTIRYNVRSPHTVGVDVNDDDATSVTLAGAAGDVTEGGAKSITLTLGRGLVSGEVLAVPLTFGGTATRGTDYTVSGASGTGLSYQNLNSGSAGVTFTGPASGATATVATLTLTAETDQAAEPAGETVDIGLGTLNASTGTGLGGGASGTDNLASFSIEDPPGNAVNLSVSASGAASEGGAALTVTATLDRANASGAAISIPIQVRTTGTTAQASDYTVASSIGIADDALSGSTSFTVTDDRIDEDTEKVVLELGAALPTGVVPGTTTAVTVTIADNDTAGLVLSPTSLGVAEGDDASYTVKLATEPTSTVTVTITGQSGTDLTLGDASLEFTTSTWNDAQTVTVDAGEDPDAAADTATLTHEASGGGYNGVSADLAVTVTDNDRPGLVLSSTSLDVDEGDDASYTVKLATEPTGTVTVAIAVSAGTDLTLDDTSLEFTTSTWNDAQTVTVAAGEDADTTDDTATLTHTASGGGYSVTASLAVTVTDDDTLPVVSFASSSSSAGEAAGTRNVTVNLSPAPTAATTSLSYTVGGTATAGSDFSIAGSGTLSVSSGATTASIPVAITDDTADESNETVLLTLTAGSGYTLGSPSSHALTIVDDDGTGPPAVSLSISPNPVTEGSAVTVTARLSEALSNSVTIPLALTAGTAEAGDYGSLASIAISGGQTTGTGTVTTAQDDDTADETFTVALGTLPSDVTAGTPSSVQVTIRDGGTSLVGTPSVTLSASPNPVTEGSAVMVTARLSAALSSSVTIPLALTAGTAEASDYGSLASIAISGGQTVGTGTVTTAQDADTADETFTVALGTLPSDVTAGTPSSVQVTIRDDDGPRTMPSVSIANAAPMEEGHDARFIVTLSAVSPQMVTVSYATRDGTAAAGSDYRAMEGTLRFSPGVRRRTVLVPTMDDEEDEPAETFMLELSNPTGATLAKRMGMATLNDNDDAVNRPPMARASCEPCSVPPGGAVRLTATASDPDGDPLTYVWSASAGRFAGSTRRSTARWTAPAETGRVTIRVRVSDGAGGSVSAAVTVQVVNRAPTFERSVYRFELAENLDGRRRPVDLGQVAAEDPAGDGLTYEVASGDRERFRIGARDGALRYVGPGEDFETEPNRHELTVRARDSSGAEAETRVVVAVGDVNEGPAAADDTAETLEDQAVTVDVLANDTDPDGDGLRVESVSSAAHGTTRVASGGGVTYTPAAQYHGVDRFTYVVSDGDGLTATAAVEVTVRSANDAPAAVGVIPDQSLDATVGPVDVVLAPFFDDADGDTLTYRALSSDPDVATVLVSGAMLTLTPAAHGTATVTVTAEDPGGLTAVQTFAVGVDNRLERAGLGNTLAAMARSHLASARMTLGRRMTAGGNEGSRLTVMGRAVPLGKAAARRAAEQMATGWLSSAAWSGMSAQGPGSSPFGAAGAAPGFGAYPAGGIGGPAPGGPALGGLGLGGPMAVGMPPASTGGLPGFGGFGGGSDALLRGTEFELALGGGEARSGGRWSVWGQGDVQAFQGAPAALGDEAGYAGDVWTSYLGVDARLTDRWLVGMAVSRSAGDADWQVGASRGRLRTNLTALHPYVQWSDGTRSVWAMAGGGWGDGGAGEGEAENLREATGRVSASGLGLRLGLVEYRERVGEAGFGLRADAAWAELRTADGPEAVDGLLATVNQQRLGVEIARRGRLGALALQPFGEAHLRRDGGAGQVGTGLEVAFGLGLTGGPVRLDVQGRALAVHSAVGYRERGASLTLTVGGQEREGLSLSVSPRWGDAASGAGALWQEEVYRHYLPETAQDAFAVDARGGYGMRLPNDGLLTWFGSYSHSPHGRSFVVGGSIDGLVDALLRRA